MTTWQLQDAKQRFSEVIRAAERGEPQIITRHGRDVAVVIEYEGFKRLNKPHRDFKKFLESAPIADDFEWPERTSEPERQWAWG